MAHAAILFTGTDAAQLLVKLGPIIVSVVLVTGAIPTLQQRPTADSSD